MSARTGASPRALPGLVRSNHSQHPSASRGPQHQRGEAYNIGLARRSHAPWEQQPNPDAGVWPASANGRRAHVRNVLSCPVTAAWPRPC